MSEEKDSRLQRQFSERDLQRVRNLATRKFGDKTTTTVGYKKQQTERKEGEVFEEDGKMWIMNNGIKVTFSKLDLVKKSLQLPLLCPCCSKPMRHNLDKKFYFIHKKCFNCVIDYETKLRLEGKFDVYAQTIIRSNASAFIRDLEQELEEFLQQGLDTYVTEQGDIEDWNSNSEGKKLIEKELREYIASIKAVING